MMAKAQKAQEQAVGSHLCCFVCDGGMEGARGQRAHALSTGFRAKEAP